MGCFVSFQANLTDAAAGRSPADISHSESGKHGSRKGQLAMIEITTRTRFHQSRQLGTFMPKKKDEFLELFGVVNHDAVAWARGAATRETGAFRDFWNFIADGLEAGLDARAIERELKGRLGPEKNPGPLICAAIAKAQCKSSLERAIKEEGELNLITWKKWSIANDGKDCLICSTNAAQGYIRLRDHFQSGHNSPPAHLKCRCCVLLQSELNTRHGARQ